MAGVTDRTAPLPPLEAMLAASVSVLVVDDEDDVAELIAESLRVRGYCVRTARNGEEALAVLHTTPVAAIILDIQMPVMDGAEFRQHQRHDRTLIRIPTLVMTGSDAEMMLDLAVEETVRKPVRMRQLLDFLERHDVPKHDLDQRDA